ncbi:hypothetical protein KJ940_09970, partial [Myxococcota bacterium]|nr:hypothetical protein [Myxococcota bacterium]
MNSTPPRLRPLLLGLTLLGCTTPHLDALSQVECVELRGCPDGRACVDGRCVACGDEICDGFDNDCDGEIDEGFDLTSDPARCGACDQPCDGACVNGACVTCSPEDEVCDGVDNDCDGQIDEGVTNACGACGPAPREICDGVDNDCDGEIDEGVTNACGACGLAPIEICDGVDNDCDGEIDEGVTNACGACGAPPIEVCDGVDNDCDGQIDEHFEGLGEPCEIGLGACAAVGLITCAPDQQGVRCEAAGAGTNPEPELCGDEIDNDCDGEVDEGFGIGAPCYAGLGICTVEGHIACDPNDRSAVRCEAVMGVASEELCNGLDDDCDGLVDEDFDLDNNPLHCGACDHTCVQPNSEMICDRGECFVEACFNGFNDVDGESSNGCECNPDADDIPDLERRDVDCDGLDGPLSRGIFVSTQGEDAAPGTAAQPKATLEGALILWRALDPARRPPILLDAGDYMISATLQVEGALALYGGYVFEAGAWRRPPRCLEDCAASWRLLGDAGVSQLFDVGVGARLIVEEVDLIGADAEIDNAVTIRGAGCQEIQLRALRLHAGAGADAEATGAISAEGEAGWPGGDGAADGGFGEGGVNPACANAAGGRGGAGAHVVGELYAGAAAVGGAT